MSTTISSDTYSFTSATSSSTSSASSTATTESTVMGKEDFLTLLVAQLQNQDPLNPDDPTEFTAQLAQFSSLEQLTNLNKSMEALTEAQGNSEKLSALSLIGKEVAYNSSAFSYNGSPVDIGYQLDGTASSVTLSIQDADGKTVKTIQVSEEELEEGNHFLSWDGTDMDGNQVASGDYKIVLQATAAGEDASVAAAPLIRSEVTGVDLSSGMITTQAGEVLFKNIIGVTEADTTNTETTQETASTTTVESGTDSTTATSSTATTDDTQTGQDIYDQLSQFFQQS